MVSQEIIRLGLARRIMRHKQKGLIEVTYDQSKVSFARKNWPSEESEILDTRIRDAVLDYEEVTQGQRKILKIVFEGRE